MDDREWRRKVRRRLDYLDRRVKALTQTLDGLGGRLDRIEGALEEDHHEEDAGRDPR